MANILSFVNDTRKVKIYSWIAVITISFEQIAIESQALGGELSHFNNANTYEFAVFQLMGFFILILKL